MLKIYSLTVACYFFIVHYCTSQTFQSLPVPINTPLSNESSPAFTGNGRTLVFEAAIGDYDKKLVAISTQRGGTWSKPEPVPGISKEGEKIFNGGHFISFEGNYIFFSSSRRGGIGLNDIYYLERTGNTWSAPKNLGKPINSLESENDAALSPDGRYLYFARYLSSKTKTGKPCGKIFVAERKGKDVFLEPKALPSPINMGCECNLRVLADNSITFASERTNGKGGYDQYRSEVDENGNFSNPIPLTFLNTAEDELYISIPAGGDFVYLTGKGKASTDIVKTIIPQNLQAKDVLALTGTVNDAKTKAKITGKIWIQKIKKNTQKFIGTVDGNYALFLPSHENYRLSTSCKGYFFNSILFTLDTLSRFKELRKDILLIPLKINSSIVLPLLEFTTTAEIKPSSFWVADQLIKTMQENPGVQIEVEGNIEKVIIDSVAHDDLTVMATDTNAMVNGNVQFFKNLYHNDNTLQIANSLRNYILKQGISPSRVTVKAMSDSKPCNLGSDLSVKCNDRWVEIRVTKE